MPTGPLSDAEIAEVRRLAAEGGCACEYRCGLVPVREQLPRLLDELERLRGEVADLRAATASASAEVLGPSVELD